VEGLRAAYGAPWRALSADNQKKRGKRVQQSRIRRVCPFNMPGVLTEWHNEYEAEFARLLMVLPPGESTVTAVLRAGQGAVSLF
jgi:hypothetical protein